MKLQWCLKFRKLADKGQSVRKLPSNENRNFVSPLSKRVSKYIETTIFRRIGMKISEMSISTIVHHISRPDSSRFFDYLTSTIVIENRT